MSTASHGPVTPQRLTVGVATCVALGAMVVRTPSITALVVPTAVSALLLLALAQGLARRCDEATRRRILWWSVMAFGAHLLFGLASTDLSFHVRLFLGADGIGYDRTAVKIVQHWREGMPFPFVPSGKEGFYYLLAALYWVFGAHTASGLAVNAALAAGLVPLMTDTTDRLFGRAAAHYAAPLVVVLPGLFLWTSQLMKEAAMLFVLAVAVNCAVRLMERISVTTVGLLTMSLALAFTFRAWVGLMVAAGLIVGMMVGHRSLISGFGTGVGTLVVVAGVMLASGLGYQGYQAAVSVNLQQANLVRKDLASAQTGYETDVDISRASSALTYLPQGMANFVIGPFPWQIRSARQLPFVPDMVVWWWLLPCLWLGYRRAGVLVGRRRLLMVLPAVFTILLLSLALGNFGTVVRERLQVIVLVVPLVALGLAERAARRTGPPSMLTGAERPDLVLQG